MRMLTRLAGLAGIAMALAPVMSAQQVGAPATPPKAQTVEVTPKDIQANVGDKIKFTAVAKDAAGNILPVKPMVWFAAPFDLAGADSEGVVVFHEPGEVTVGAVVAGKPGIGHINVGGAPAAEDDNSA